jgi:hypothetical protein
MANVWQDNEACTGNRCSCSRRDSTPGHRDEVVLVVEDKERAFREFGHAEAGGLVAALHVIDAYSEIIPLFSDMVISEMNGRQFTQDVILRLPKLKDMFTTGFSSNAVVHDGDWT